MSFDVFPSVRFFNLKPACVLAVLVFTIAVHGETREWTGGAQTADWDDAANWSPAGVPAAGDAVTVSGGAKVTLTNETPKLASFVLTGSGTTLTMKEAVRAAIGNCKTLLHAETVNITDGAVVTHAANTQTYAEYRADVDAGWLIDGRVNISCDVFYLAEGSRINANHLGYSEPLMSRYPANVGPGGVTNKVVDAFAASAGHGGYGSGQIYLDAGVEGGLTMVCCEPYDPVDAPVMPGSSGSHNNSNLGLHGGGVVKIIVTGRATVDGDITADAYPVTGNVYLGSGGSVWLTAGSVAGSGLISANGGFSANSRVYSGSGGRVAIVYDAAAQDTADVELGGVPALRFRAAARCSNSTAIGRTIADVGSVYMSDDRFLTDTFDGSRGVVDGQIWCGSWGRWTPASLTVDDCWVRFMRSPVVTNGVPGAITVTGRYGCLEIGGDETFPWSYSFNRTAEAQNRAPRVRLSSSVRPAFSCAELTVTDGGQFDIYPGCTNGLDGAYGATLAVSGDITVGTNAFVLLPCHPTNGAVVKVTAENFTVERGGTVSSAGQGFVSYKLYLSKVLTAGISPGTPVFNSTYMRAGNYGSGYGGYGTTVRDLCLGKAYGSLEYPDHPGSAGGYSYSKYGGSSGGGAVLVEARKKIVVDGLMDVRGQNSDNNNNETGTGGSVNLVCETFEGSGTVDASSGYNAYNNPKSVTSAGGRIALHYDRAAQTAAGKTVTVTWKNNSIYRSSGETVCNRGRSGVGTIWFSDMRFLGDRFGAGTVMSGELHFGEWTGWSPAGLTADGPDVNVRIPTYGHDLEIKGDLRVVNGASLGFGGGTNRFTHSGWYPAFSPAGLGPVVRVAGSLVMNALGGSAKNELHVFAGDGCGVDEEGVGALLSIGRHLQLGTNSWIYPVSEPYCGKSVKVTVRNKAKIEVNAGVDASGFGYSGGIYPVSQWQSKGYGPGAVSGRGIGGSYGGRGAYGASGTPASPPALQTNAQGVAIWTVPKMPGSGGSIGDKGVAGSGGGLVWLEVGRSIETAGKFLANGARGTAMSWEAAGSGGGIYIECRDWKPSATAEITAKGGNTTGSTGSGGGGCVAIWRARDFDTVLPDERTYASSPAGGTSTTDGTVYWGDLPLPGMMIFLR